jgi:hypothetical protein
MKTDVESLLETMSFLLAQLEKEQNQQYIPMHDYLRIQELAEVHLTDQSFFHDQEQQLEMLIERIQRTLEDYQTDPGIVEEENIKNGDK